MAQADDGVWLGHAPVAAETDVNILMEAGLALVAIDACLAGHLVVVGHDHAALGAGHDFGRIKAERAGDAKGAGMAPTQTRSMGMGRVLHQPQAALLGQRGNGRHGIGDDTGDMHDHDASRIRRELAQDLCRGGREGAQIAVHEDRIAAGRDDGSGGRHEGVGRHQHIAPCDLQHAQDDLERTGAAVDRDRMARTAQPREFRLELLPVAAERQLAVGQHFIDALGDPVSILGREVDTNGRHGRSRAGLGCGRHRDFRRRSKLE